MTKILLIICLGTTVFTKAQNVGIGTLTPGVPLDVKSASAAHLMRLDGANNMYVSINENEIYRGYIGSYAGNAEDVDFGTGSGNSTGKVHLTIQGNPRLTLAPNGNVGIGNINPTWKLDVNGGMQLLGSLFVSGSSGETGQVLTSSGSGAPSWQTLNAAFDNNIRFAFLCSDPNNTGGSLTITNRYNTNPTAVSASGTTITFNTTGIYHFEVAIMGRIDYASALSYEPLFSVNMVLGGGTGSGNNPVAQARLAKHGVVANSYFENAFASTDMYITAGQTLTIVFGYTGTSYGTITEIDTFGYLRGYLISN